MKGEGGVGAVRCVCPCTACVSKTANPRLIAKSETRICPGYTEYYNKNTSIYSRDHAQLFWAIETDQLVLVPSFIINKVCELVAKILYCAHKVVSYNLIWN